MGISVRIVCSMMVGFNSINDDRKDDRKIKDLKIINTL